MTQAGTFMIEGPGLDGCVPIWDVASDAARCAMAMNVAWVASHKLAAQRVEARSAHYHKCSRDVDLSHEARTRCHSQAQCLHAVAGEIERGTEML